MAPLVRATRGCSTLFRLRKRRMSASQQPHVSMSRRSRSEARLFRGSSALKRDLHFSTEPGGVDELGKPGDQARASDQHSLPKLRNLPQFLAQNESRDARRQRARSEMTKGREMDDLEIALAA